MSGCGSDMSVTQMYWKPALMRLTQIPHPDMDGAEGSACYLDPQSILSINRTFSGFSKEWTPGSTGDPQHREYHSRIACTCVMTSYGHALMVMEAPEMVAMLRDRALGHETRPKVAS